MAGAFATGILIIWLAQRPSWQPVKKSDEIALISANGQRRGDSLDASSYSL
jgi:hypothetical protein